MGVAQNPSGTKGFGNALQIKPQQGTTFSSSLAITMKSLQKKNATTETEFRNNLTQYIKEAKAKGARPVLITPVARRKFDSEGNVMGTHEVYSKIVRDVAKLNETPLIDLDKKSQALYQKMGVENSKLLLLHLQPGEHPNYPDGKTDDTHFSELGARLVAQIVLADIKDLLPELAGRIVKKNK